jgi:hypothetical protein
VGLRDGSKRPDYLTAVLDKLMNWEFAAQNLASADPSAACGPRPIEDRFSYSGLRTCGDSRAARPLRS